MKTVDEVVQRMAEADPADIFGTMHSDLLEHLPFEMAKPHLKDGVTAEIWGEHQKPLTDEAVKATMLDYMPFAWEKANNCRGLSAMRSIQHMQTWLWLLGYDQAATAIAEYTTYGKPQLRAICEEFGWDWRQWDDGHWRSSEDDTGEPPPQAVMALPKAA